MVGGSRFGMQKKYYSFVIFLILVGWGCTRINIKTSILKPKESDFRNYAILKVTDLAHSPPYEIVKTIPDRVAEEIRAKNLFKTVQRIHKISPTSGDRRTLVLKLSVADFFPGTGERGVWWGGHIVIQCSVIEKLTNSEIFRCKLSSPLEVYMEENIERGFKKVTDRMVKEIADIIERCW